MTTENTFLRAVPINMIRHAHIRLAPTLLHFPLVLNKCWVKVSLPNAGLACILGISMHEFFGAKTVLIPSASCLFVPFEHVQKRCTCRSAVPLGIRTFAAKNPAARRFWML